MSYFVLQAPNIIHDPHEGKQRPMTIPGLIHNMTFSPEAREMMHGIITHPSSRGEGAASAHKGKKAEGHHKDGLGIHKAHPSATKSALGMRKIPGTTY